MSFDAFMEARYQEGYEYELIDGKLYVVAFPELQQARVEHWIGRQLDRFSDVHPEVINFVYRARVFVHGRAATTAVEPDYAAYHAFPFHLPLSQLDWFDVSPILVVEVASPTDQFKDFVRNVALYLEVPTIKEYWILDNREDCERPTLHVNRRQGNRWCKLQFHYGETYTTTLLPGFELKIDPRWNP